ncbi:MAG: efflux transporter outer membrane subunit [Tepidisphaeraceae bacterium]|jgi:NodT family efflux transporter outer membrane factor (OMF) lipoprotein
MAHKKIFSAALAAVLTAAGCEVGPDYHPPQITVKSAYGEPIAAPSASAAPTALIQWWSAFHDPELDGLIQRAIKNNLDLKNAESRLRQARAQRGVVGSELFPTVNTSGGYQNARGSKNVTIPLGAFGGAAGPAATPTVRPAVVSAAAAQGGSASVASTPSVPLSPLGQGGFPGVETQLYQAGFDASWELDVFGGVRRSIEAADADTAAALEDRRDLLVSLVAEVARNYIDLRSAQRQMQIATDNLQSQQETLELTRSRYRAGFVTELDVAREAAQVATTAATLPALDASIRLYIHELGILLGQDPDALAAELTAAAPIPPAPPAVPLGVPADLLRRRPDIRRAERQLAAATARIGVATADLYPKFTLTGSFGLDSSKVHNLAEWSSRYFALNPGVTWPIFDAGKIRSNVAVQKELAQQAATNYQQTVLSALKEVEDALAAYRTEQLRRNALADAVDASQQAVSLARQQYQRGVVDFLVVLDTQRSLFETQMVLAQSDSAISTDLVALYKALGGGWELAAANAPTPPAAQPR